MARPTEEGLKFFSHDTDASTDEKIETLRMLYGNDGYAFYFILLERIYRSNDAELDISDPETCQILCRKLLITEQKFSEILQKSLKVGLFDKDAYNTRKALTSNGIKRRSSIVLKKREAMKERYKEQKNEQNIDGVSDAETQKELLKVKESKVKESKTSKVKEGDLSDFFKELKTEFTQIDVDLEIKNCETWWADSKKKMGHPKSAYRNWMIKAVEIKNNHHDKLQNNYKPVLNQYKYVEDYNVAKPTTTP